MNILDSGRNVAAPTTRNIAAEVLMIRHLSLTVEIVYSIEMI